MPNLPRNALKLLVAAFAASGLLGGCSSLLTEGASAGAGVGGAAVAHALNANGAVTAGIGLGTQAVALAGVQLMERKIHTAEQDEIARAAGTLPVGGVAPWRIDRSMPIVEGNEQGSVTVSRTLGAPSGDLDCKEIVFSVDTVENKVPQRAFFTAAVCRDGAQWKWATAEPATERWGALQ